MSRYPKKERHPLTDYSSLPIVLHSNHIVEVLGCCEATALKTIRQWDKQKIFPVIWCGNSPRINRDAFLFYFTGGLIGAGPDEQAG